MKIMYKSRLKKILISKGKHAYHAVETEMAILKKLVILTVNFLGPSSHCKTF